MDISKLHFKSELENRIPFQAARAGKRVTRNHHTEVFAFAQRNRAGGMHDMTPLPKKQPEIFRLPAGAAGQAVGDWKKSADSSIIARR